MLIAQIERGLFKKWRPDCINRKARCYRIEADHGENHKSRHASSIFIAGNTHQVVSKPLADQAMNALLGHPGPSGIGIEIRNMQAGLVGHGELTDIPCMVGKLAVEIEFALAQGLTERLIEVAVELIGTSHHRDQIGHVMRYVPTVYPGIVFAVVGTRPLSARKT